MLAGAPSAEELEKIRTRKPAPPVIEIKLKSGEEVPIWCTFSDQQVSMHHKHHVCPGSACHLFTCSADLLINHPRRWTECLSYTH